MRSYGSQNLNPGALLSDRNLSVLQRPNFLFRSAYNSALDDGVTRAG